MSKGSKMSKIEINEKSIWVEWDGEMLRPSWRMLGLEEDGPSAGQELTSGIAAIIAHVLRTQEEQGTPLNAAGTTWIWAEILYKTEEFLNYLKEEEEKPSLVLVKDE